MSMAKSDEDLQKLSDDELKQEYDRVAKNTMVGLNYYKDEIIRREQSRQARRNTLLSVWSLIISILALAFSAIAVFASKGV